MLRARITFSDLRSPLIVDAGSIILGHSEIIPFHHRLHRTLLLETDRKIAVISYERFADERHELYIETRLSDDEFEHRLERFADHPFDFSILTIDRHSSEIRYRASPVISVPIYLVADEHGASIDWDHLRLLTGHKPEIVWDKILAQIAGISIYGPTTVLAGVYRATAGATLTLSAAGVVAELPEPICHDGPQGVAPEADLEASLFETIKSLVAARPIERLRTVVELSGGMDSALTSLATAAALGSGLMSIGAQFGGPMGDAQRARRQILRNQGVFDDISLPAERFASFSPASACRVRYGVSPDDENYPEMSEALFGALRTSGIDTLVSGFGGDELYFAYEGEDGTSADSGREQCPFLTKRGLEIAATASIPYPLGWLQETCWQSAAARSQRLLRHGLWPIYPYHNVSLARFLSRLPSEYRHDRRLLRKTLSRLTGNMIFETDYVKETFYPVALRGMVENREYLIGLVARSMLSAHPEIDDNAIMAALTGDLSALAPSAFWALFRTLKIVCFFQDS